LCGFNIRKEPDTFRNLSGQILSLVDNEGDVVTLLVSVQEEMVQQRKVFMDVFRVL